MKTYKVKYSPAWSKGPLFDTTVQAEGVRPVLVYFMKYYPFAAIREIIPPTPVQLYKDFQNGIIKEIASRMEVPIEVLTQPIPEDNGIESPLYMQRIGRAIRQIPTNPYLTEINALFGNGESNIRMVTVHKGQSLGPTTTVMPGVDSYIIDDRDYLRPEAIQKLKDCALEIN